MTDSDNNVIDFRAATPRPDAAASFYSRGLGHDRFQDCDKAIAAFSRAIELNPIFADAYFKRSTAHRRNRDYDKAAADFDQAIQILWRQCQSVDARRQDLRNKATSRQGFGGQQATREAAAIAG